MPLRKALFLSFLLLVLVILSFLRAIRKHENVLEFPIRSIDSDNLVTEENYSPYVRISQ